MVWNGAIILTIAAAIWVAFQNSNDFTRANSGWYRVLSMAQTARLELAAALAIGIAISVVHDTSPSRLAAYFGAVGGAWLAVAGGMLVAYSVFSPEQEHAPVRVTVPFVVHGLAFILMGLVLAVTGWRIATDLEVDDGAGYDDEADDAPAPVS